VSKALLLENLEIFLNSGDSRQFGGKFYLKFDISSLIVLEQAVSTDRFGWNENNAMPHEGWFCRRRHMRSCWLQDKLCQRIGSAMRSRPKEIGEAGMILPRPGFEKEDP